MDLKGAEIRSFYEVSINMIDNDEVNHGLKIPHYQRPYRWEEENVEKLVDDWFNHEDETDYFCGSVVTVGYPDRHHDLIDGQQRLTTLFLANFTLFLILRELVYTTLTVSRYFPKYETFYDEMMTCLRYLFTDKSYIESLENLKEIIYEQRSDEIENEIDDRESAVDLFVKRFGLCVNTTTEQEKYCDSLYGFLKNGGELFLTYDRLSFNDSLMKILSQTLYSLSDQSVIRFKFIECNDAPLSESEENYKNAIKVIIEYFQDKLSYEHQTDSKRESVEKSIELKDSIRDFIKDVKVCTVQTGNPDDAYTLFEVLNDRALALDDLDLIKNLFYKTFVLNSDSSEKDKDRVLKKLDDMWVEDIFKPGTSESEKKLVTYLAIVYITGDDSITYNSSSDYRSSLKEYFKNQNKYSESAITRDFNIFYACRSIVNIFEVKFKSKDLVAVEAEYKNLHITRKLVHLLMALKQEGVLSGFVNYLLKKLSSSCSNFDPIKVRGLIEQLVSDSDNRFGDIEEQAENLWKVAILSKDATNPRKFAVDLIKKNSLKSPSSSKVLITSSQERAYTEDFEQWLKKWQYSRTNTVKLRILFAKILSRSLDSNGNITNKPFELNIKPELIKTIQLDHMEPKKAHHNDSRYFQSTNRDLFINGIGNMMPLPAYQNRKKSDSPLIDSIKYYDEVGIGEHFIIQKTKELLKDNQFVEDQVPKEAFFNERRDMLISWFKEALIIST